MFDRFFLFFLQDVHDIRDCCVEFTVFSNAKQFFLWKAQLEENSLSYFVKKRRCVSYNETLLLFSCAAARKSEFGRCGFFGGWGAWFVCLAVLVGLVGYGD